MTGRARRRRSPSPRVCPAASGSCPGPGGLGILDTVASIATSLASALVFLVITALLAYFMLRDGDRGWAWITSHLDGWRRTEVTLAGDRAVTMLGGYMIATGVLGAFNAVTGFIVMTLLGLPLALPVAILSFFGGFIPYIGQFVTSLIAFLVAVAFGTTQDVIIMGIWTAVFNVVQGSVIAPLVYGRAVSLHPAIVLIVIPAGGALAGVLGMFLAVPLVGIVGAVWRTHPGRHRRGPAPGVGADRGRGSSAGRDPGARGAARERHRVTSRLA